MAGSCPPTAPTGPPQGAPKAPPETVAERIIASLAAGQTIVFPDDTSAGVGSVYLSDPVKLEQMLAG